MSAHQNHRHVRFDAANFLEETDAVHLGQPIRTDGVVRKLADNRDALGVSKGFTSHSIRHGCLTWLAENGCPRDVRDRISNHAPAASGGVDHIYVAAERNLPAREWLGRWVDYLSALEAENVVSITESA